MKEKETCITCPSFILTLQRCATNSREIKTKGFAIPKWCIKNKKIDEEKNKSKIKEWIIVDGRIVNIYDREDPANWEKFAEFDKIEFAKMMEEMDKQLKESNQKSMNDRGSRFNEGKLRWSLVDLKYLEGLVQVLMNGAEKYGDYNFQKGLPTLEVYESLMRHIVAWRSGEDKDKESGLDHIDHAICNLYFMKWMIANKPSFDTRRNVVPEQEFTEPKYPSENEK